MAEDRLRRKEALSGSEIPGKALAADAHRDAQILHLAALDLRLEVAGIHQHHAVAIAPVLGCLFVAKNDKRIVLVAGHASPGADLRDEMPHRRAAELPFHAMPSVEMDQIPFAEGKVQHG